MSAKDSPLGVRLVEHDGLVRGIVEREAGGRLLRFETAADLVQDIHCRALRAEGGFEFQGDAPFRAWLVQVTRNHMAERRRYWSALRRNAGPVLRLVGGSVAGDSRGEELALAASGTGATTFAVRRELVVQALRVLTALLPRDRELVAGMSEGHSIAEEAQRRGISVEAAQRARLRALERFRKAWRLATEPRRPGPG